MSALQPARSVSSLLVKRLPRFSELWQVFGLVVFVVFSRSIWGFLYQLPSVRLFMSTDDIFGILCYSLAFALLESMLIMGALVLFCALLPSAALKRGFVHKAFLIVLTILVASLLLERSYTVVALYYPGPAPYALAALCVGLSGLMLSVMLLIVHIDPRLRRSILFVADRASLFAYIYVPLGLLGMVVVAARILL